MSIHRPDRLLRYLSVRLVVAAAVLFVAAALPLSPPQPAPLHPVLAPGSLATKDGRAAVPSAPTSRAASSPSAPAAKQFGIPLAPYLQPGDFAGYAVGDDALPAMPFANCTYRIVGPGLLPLTDELRVGIEGVFHRNFEAPALKIMQISVHPTPSAPNATRDVYETYDSALAANHTRVIAFAGNFGPDNTVPTLDQYQSIDINVVSAWTPNSSWAIQGAIEATYNQFVEHYLLQAGITAKCFCIQKTLLPRAAPILMRLPIAPLASYVIVLQVIGPQVPPMDVKKQVLIIGVLNNALLTTAGAGCMRIANMTEAILQPPPGNNPALPPIGVANLTLISSQKDLTAQPLPQALDMLFNSFVISTNLRTAGLNVSVSVLSVDRLWGDSATEQAAIFTGALDAVAPAPGPQPSLLSVSTGQSKETHLSVGQVAGVAVGVVAAMGLVLTAGLLWWQHKGKVQSGATPAASWKQEHGFDDSRSLGRSDLEDPSRRRSSAVGRRPCLTEFQEAAIAFGVPGMSQVHRQLHGSAGSEQSSTEQQLLQRSSATPTVASALSGFSLTDHTAAGHVHGWDIAPDDIELCCRPDGSDWVLGSGSFGMVFRAVRSGMQDVAVKTLTNADEQQLKQFRKEISILKSLSFDRNIVQFYGACVQGGKPMLVLEYMEGGDLCQAMSGPRGSELTWYAKGALIALDVARGLHFLHTNRVMHSDLKAKNVLLTKDLSTAKIGDVGLARIMSSAFSSSSMLGGTFAYAAPELLINDHCSEKVDIYSFGVLLWELITHESPQRGHLRTLKVPEECPAAIVQLIDDCLEVDPSARPTARELFNRIKDAYEAASNDQTLASISSLSTEDSEAARLSSVISSKLQTQPCSPETLQGQDHASSSTLSSGAVSLSTPRFRTAARGLGQRTRQAPEGVATCA